jgi:Holliday junction resolvase RusA-like endonuclease
MDSDTQLLHSANETLIMEVKRLRKRWTDRIFRPWDKKKAVRINIKPKSKARPRFNSRTMRAYMPTPYTNWIKEFQAEVEDVAHLMDIQAKPTSMYVVAHVKMPKHWPKKRKKACRGTPHNNQRLDVDNMAGAIMDGFYPTKKARGGGRDPDAIGGDGHVWRLQAAKVWDDEDFLEIYIETQEEVTW